jgi:hypothetical protein
MSLDRKKNLQDALDNLLEVCIKTRVPKGKGYGL